MGLLKRMRLSPLGFAAGCSAVLFVALVVARLMAWDGVRSVYIGYGGYGLMTDVAPEGVHLGLRRTLRPWRDLLGPARWFMTASSSPTAAQSLTDRCCGQQECWVLPGMWMGAGRSGLVDYFDVILPNWLTMPLSLLFPALGYRQWRRRRAVRGRNSFEVAGIAADAVAM